MLVAASVADDMPTHELRGPYEECGRRSIVLLFQITGIARVAFRLQQSDRVGGRFMKRTYVAAITRSGARRGQDVIRNTAGQ